MDIALWSLQGLLALIMLGAGGMKLTKTKDEMKAIGGDKMAWVDSVSATTIRLIGLSEVLIALGLVLPQLTGILPWLTPLAAVGLVLTMIGATALHVKRGEGAPPMNLVLLALAAFVAYGRFVLLPA